MSNLNPDRKHFLASKTFWGSVVPIALAAMRLLGYKIPGGDNAIMVEALVLIGGGVLAIVGRVKAKTDLKII